MTTEKAMKRKYEVEEKPFTSSLNICPEACWRNRLGAGGTIPPPPSPPPYFPRCYVNFYFKDDVTVIFLISISLMEKAFHLQSADKMNNRRAEK
jgi:hypothetical protein